MARSRRNWAAETHARLMAGINQLVDAGIHRSRAGWAIRRRAGAGMLDACRSSR
jgi:hypothetical protein